MGYHGAMLATQDTARLDNLRGAVRVLALDICSTGPDVWVTVDDLAGAVRQFYPNLEFREDSIRRMLGYIKADGVTVEARRTQGGIAEYRVKPKQSNGQQTIF